MIYHPVDILGYNLNRKHLHIQEGSVLHVKEIPYTVREARIHVRHIRDLLKSLEYIDAYNGAECSSLSFLNTVTQGDIIGELELWCHYVSFI